MNFVGAEDLNVVGVGARDEIDIAPFQMPGIQCAVGAHDSHPRRAALHITHFRGYGCQCGSRIPSSRIRSEYIDRSLSAGHNCTRAKSAEPTTRLMAGARPQQRICADRCLRGRRNLRSPSRAASARSAVLRRIAAKSEAGKS